MEQNNSRLRIIFLRQKGKSVKTLRDKIPCIQRSRTNISIIINNNIINNTNNRRYLW